MSEKANPFVCPACGCDDRRKIQSLHTVTQYEQVDGERVAIGTIYNYKCRNCGELYGIPVLLGEPVT